MVMMKEHEAYFAIQLLYVHLQFVFFLVEYSVMGKMKSFACDERALDEINGEICLSLQIHSSDELKVCGIYDKENFSTMKWFQGFVVRLFLIRDEKLQMR